MDLRVIITQYEEAKRAKLKDGDTDYQKQEEFLFWLFESGQLGKMIDRVQVLELELEHEKNTGQKQLDEYADGFRHYRDKCYELEQQNKRYREAILLALCAPEEHGSSPGMIIRNMKDVLERLLEESE